jgi:hypothetical protein
MMRRKARADARGRMLRTAVVLAALTLTCTTAINAQAQVYAYFNQDPYVLLNSEGLLSDFQNDVMTQSSVAGISVNISWETYDSGSVGTGPSLNTTLTNGLALLDKHLNMVAGNKTINLIVWAGTDADPNESTPSYIFDPNWPAACQSLHFGCTTTASVDTCDCNNYHGANFMAVGSNCSNDNNPLMVPFDGGGVPATWEQPFYLAYEYWLGKLIDYYTSTSGIAGQIGYIRVGVGTGGGSAVACPNVEMGTFLHQTGLPNVLLNEGVWKAYNNNVYASVHLAALAASSPMVLTSSPFGGVVLGMGDGSIPTSWADDVAQVATANGLGIGSEGLAATTNKGDPLLYSLGQPCADDWCSLFNSYYSDAPIQTLQTVSQSNPNCLNQSSSCNGTGSLVTVLPFGTQRRATAFEIYYQDLLCAYDLNGYSNTDCPASPNTAYQMALTNAAAGQPNSTSSLNGGSALVGAATIQ